MKRKSKIFMGIGIAVAVILIVVLVVFFINKKTAKPEEALNQYVELLNAKDYEGMYDLITEESKGKISKEDFITRNKNIYEGVEAFDVKLDNIKASKEKDKASVDYDTTMNTLAGELKFSNTMNLIKEGDDKKYKIEWASKLIFPDLTNTDKVRVGTTKAKRGSILDRNEVPLAMDGTALEVGIVPGKLGAQKDDSIKKISDILGISVDTINGKLNASYVQPEMFIPMKVIAKDDKRKTDLLKIPGIMINDKAARVYPLGEKAAHLTGYVQSINADELAKLEDKNYNKNSIIGKNGLEKIYEDKLRGINGAEVYIVDKDNKKKSTVIAREAKNGTDLKLTIDNRTQSLLYGELEKDKGASVAMNPKTGEVLALVSTPSYNPNEFVMGVSQEKWDSLNNDKNKPLYNRFQSNIVPGSVFKPITAAIGVDSKAIDPNGTKNISGTKWQKDSGWGSYFVTRVKDYGATTNLMNAMIYSDNIYFAQSALDIGKETFAEKLKAFGFGEEIPFEYGLSKSQFAADGQFKSEVQLADSGYGQGEILVNPIQLASIYTLFVNEGNIINPYLEYKDGASGKPWKSNVVSKEAADIVLKDLIQVVDSANGTGHEAYTQGLTLAGKTGTAEVKLTQDDTTGTEIGWFTAMTAGNSNKNLLVLSMVEDVKDRGGSHYVIPKVKKAFENLK